MAELQGRTVYPGCVDGSAIVAQTPFPLSGMTFDFGSGSVKWAGHELSGHTVRGKILVLPEIRAFAGGDWALFSLSTLYGTAPQAILCGDMDAFVIAGAILGKIVTIAGLPSAFLQTISTGDRVHVDTERGLLRIERATGTASAVSFKVRDAQEPPAFELTSEEGEILAGAQGRAASECLDFMIRYGKAKGASRLIPIESVHASGSGYNTTGEAALAYLTRLADDGAKVRVPATLNPIAIDLARWREVMRMPAELNAKQASLNDAFNRLGFAPIYSCAPYWTGNIPRFGSNIVWSEHNAASFANSVIGARTNFESHLATIPAAVVGRIPYHGLYLPENRRPSIAVNVTARMTDPVDWRYLGVAAAARVGSRIPIFCGLRDTPSEHHLRDLCSALGPPWSGTPMLHVEGITPEAREGAISPAHMASLETVTVDAAAMQRVRIELSGERAGPIDLVALGCPQYSAREIQTVADRLRSRKVKDGIQLWILTDAATRAKAERAGAVQTIVEAGGQVLADTCGCAACPVGRSGFGFRGVATDSTKSCGFLGSTGLKMHVGSLDECIDAAVSGTWQLRAGAA